MEIVEEEPLSPCQNMESDYQKLLSISAATPATLRFYQWPKEAATYGYFLDPSKYLVANTLSVARRPTGGGIIFHDFDLAFSLLIPAHHSKYSLNTLENYSFVNGCLLKALQEFNPKLPIELHRCKGESKPNFCMAKSTIYDLTVAGKKIVGGAMRKTSKGFLHQGSICLRLPSSEFLKKHLKDASHVEEILHHSYPLLHESTELEKQKSQLKRCITASFGLY